MRPNRGGWPANGKLRSAGGHCPLNYLFARVSGAIRTEHRYGLATNRPSGFEGPQRSRARGRGDLAGPSVCLVSYSEAGPSLFYTVLFPVLLAAKCYDNRALSYA